VSETARMSSRAGTAGLMTGVSPPTGSIAISRHGGKRATRAVNVEEAHEMDFVTRARLNALLAHDANPADQRAAPTRS
jgi:hypothetical protein